MSMSAAGADPEFQVRGAHFKKIAPSGGKRENFGYFVWKITILRQKKIIFFPILGGVRAPPPPPWIRPYAVY